MRGRFEIIVLAVVSVGGVAAADGEGLVDVTGTYEGTLGTTTLHQDGDHVTGAYAARGGTIDGELDGTRLTFTWSEDGGHGRGVLEVLPDAQLVGSWGRDGSATDGGAWVLTPSGAGAAATDGTEGVIASPLRAYHASPVDLRLPWAVELRPGKLGGMRVGEGGLGVDVGHMIGGNVYVGVSAEWERLAILGGGSASALRAAAELRFYLGGSGLWFGTRTGVDREDGETAIYVDAMLGADRVIGPVGFYVSSGAHIEHAPATAATGPGAMGPPVMGPASFLDDLGLGARVSFW